MDHTHKEFILLTITNEQVEEIITSEYKKLVEYGKRHEKINEETGYEPEPLDFYVQKLRDINSSAADKMAVFTEDDIMPGYEDYADKSHVGQFVYGDGECWTNIALVEDWASRHEYWNKEHWHDEDEFAQLLEFHVFLELAKLAEEEASVHKLGARRKILAIVHLNLTRQWYDMIASRKKPEEYREIKPFYERIFTPKGIKVKGKYYRPTNVAICFSNGYKPNRDQMMLNLNYIAKREGKEEWGAEPNKKYFVLSLGSETRTDELQLENQTI